MAQQSDQLLYIFKVICHVEQLVVVLLDKEEYVVIF